MKTVLVVGGTANADVVAALYPLFLKHGRPEFTRSDMQSHLSGR